MARNGTKLATKCEHTTRLVKGRGMCSPCYTKWLMDRDPAFKERTLAKSRAWRNNNKLWHKDWRQRNPGKIRNYQRISSLRQSFGLSLEAYDVMLKAQGGACAICRNPETARGKVHLSVDHCHRTGVVRGLLCGRCNRGVGYFRDQPDLLRHAAQYLEKFNGNQYVESVQDRKD